MIVEPSTTCEFSESPLKAATVRVVRLLAAAIDHSVSPGCTVCGTEALAGTAAKRAKMTANSGVRRKALASCVVSDSPRLALHVRYWKRVARGYVALHKIARRGRPQALGSEVALVRAKFPALEPRAHPLRVRQAPRLRALADSRERAGDVRRRPARD